MLNFTLSELIKSDTAKRYGIDNTPPLKALDNLLKLIVNVLQPIRDEWKEPITVTSGYRCKALNTKVKGAVTSDHLNGDAADIKSSDNKKLFDLINNMIKEGKIKVGLLIDEYNYSWIHISNPTAKHTNNILHLK